ncbi:calcium-binding and coiled-coil domain-containing protein 2 [Hemicordylus capensis]|uniref:calcium-binding and coiled-coil domain-containing protein 2 n=1 Tax=Hemicordylus capensis TaxID=884348 RepID=UPI002304719C|nr:calcium-binding and coiled-coil domain-containing protein 2 [Hemicordylus capensis]XP_053118078.1 calcium-binding and coiled-coil domain-containing protein 2 [Hemicordylus capensis]XP_053118079.1 calcium-binding and coiled-coil domain-containing protein 2 [Hemicordylus capensis]XP_053118080.1 calcium-binding and coiled-coil domain-containing protein 2 [Hemicordylus capensis]
MEALLNDNSEEPPTSIALLDSCHFSQVIFTTVEKFYVPGADVTCHYTLSQYIKPCKKDWVGIFRVGWKTTREYYTFMWAPSPSGPDNSDAKHQQVLFKAYYLPKDDEYYQFCYVDHDGIVRGASVPFQFRAEAEDDMLVVTTQGEVEEIEQQNATLQQENQKLKENLTNLQKQNEDLQEKLTAAQEKAKELESKVHLLQSETMELQRTQDLQVLEISSAQTELAVVTETNVKLQRENQDLQKSLETLKSSHEKFDLQLNFLKTEIAQLETQNGAKEAELHQIKEENKTVLSAKDQLENKLKATLDRMDQLQAQVQSQQQEVENLQEADEAKSRHLKQLKEENRQMNATVLRQQKYADLDKKLEEKTLLLQALQKEKDDLEKENQRLKQKNEELMAYSPEVIPDMPPGVPNQLAENASLLFGNPYSLITELPDTSLEPMKKCPMCDTVFPSDIGEQQYMSHVRSHLLECPYCEESFDKSNKQVYEDHIYCHGLD